MNETDKKIVEAIQLLLQSLSTDEARLASINCICKYCGTLIIDDTCYCTRDN